MSGAISTRVISNYKTNFHKNYGSPEKYNQKFHGKNKLQLYMQDHATRVRESSRRKKKFVLC